MKAEELRIGNWFMDQFGEEIICHGIIDGDFFNDILGDVPCNACQPIHLTERWLIDFGFEKENQYVVGVGSYSKMVKGEFVLLLNNEGHYYAVTCPFKPVLKSVHHLQNLYFSLTSEELT